MKITALAENTACSEQFKSVHGLSLYIKTPNHRLVFDIGPDETFIKNAQKANVNLSQVDSFIISHGHADHAGAMKMFEKINNEAKIYAQTDAFEPHFAKFMGLPISVSIKMPQNAQRVVFNDGVLKIDDELTIFCDVKGEKFFPSGNKSLYAKNGGKMLPDDFSHEQSLIITAQGISVLVAGCAHKGIVNIVERAREILGKYPDKVIAGTHLFNPVSRKYDSDENIEGVARALNDMPCDFYTCHCTGVKAYEKMRAIMGEKMKYISSGQTVEL